MQDIYIFATIFAVLMAVFGLGCLCWRDNPIYQKAQLRMLSVGQVRRNLLSSQDKDGSIIFVVKEFIKKKKLIGKGEKITHIISDTYIKMNGDYVRDIIDRKDTVASFFKLTDPEPVYKDERICAKPSTKSSSKKSA